MEEDTSIFTSLNDLIGGVGDLFGSIGGTIDEFDKAFGTDFLPEAVTSTGTTTNPQQPPQGDNSLFGDVIRNASPTLLVTGGLGVVALIAIAIITRK